MRLPHDWCSQEQIAALHESLPPDEAIELAARWEAMESRLAEYDAMTPEEIQQPEHLEEIAALWVEYLDMSADLVKRVAGRQTTRSN